MAEPGYLPAFFPFYLSGVRGGKRTVGDTSVCPQAVEGGQSVGRMTR